ncbi:macrophage mannose receptor 1-like [Gouania willdenowi]|uniref:macrophage mannose receptor 1-like n=1 Tax=Gouania willdenowi TaxID=441366 RepID=UPI0010566048|nr:macrophage mannose receptor 1-like [Gouania willdenowi]XP_028327162.1 macrophage mannose receptor 1-like [Gouania willdenowi]
MDYRVIVVLIHLGFGFTFSSTVPHRVYHYVNMRMSWADAQSYCRDKYKDLATFESMEDIQKLKRPSVASAQAWIGLRDDPKSWKETFGNATNSWRWSATEKPSFTNYSNWKDGSPKRFREQRYCSLVMVSGDWTEATCSQIREFICFDDSNPPGQKIYTLKMTKSSWEDAQSYCRANHKDLAMVENAQEQSDMIVGVVDFTWFGLYRQPWSWSDGSSSSFKNWNTNQPDEYLTDGHCVFETQEHFWYNAACTEKFVFICYEDVPEVKMQMVRMKIQSDADLSDPAVSDYILQQLTAQLQKYGQPELKLRWKKKPAKEENQELSTDDCNL